jgi:hypothetical protein
LEISNKPPISLVMANFDPKFNCISNINLSTRPRPVRHLTKHRASSKRPPHAFVGHIQETTLLLCPRYIRFLGLDTVSLNTVSASRLQSNNSTPRKASVRTTTCVIARYSIQIQVVKNNTLSHSVFTQDLHTDNTAVITSKGSMTVAVRSKS